MNNNKLSSRKWVGILFILLLMFSLVACGSDENGNDTPEDEGISFVVSDVRNDVTGNWKIAKTSDSIEVKDIALEYYNKYFESDAEVHAIVNFTYNTTTKITSLGDKLDVTVYEYVEDEEHDAKDLFSGMFLKEYYVDKETGEIEEA